MKISIDKSVLVSALDIVSKASSNKATMPILEGVLLEVQDKYLNLTCNNLDTSIRYTAECEVFETGAIVANAKLFSDIIKRMPDDEIDISTDDRRMTIKAGKTKMEIPTISATGFPEIPVIKNGESYEIDCQVLTDMVGKVSFAVCIEEGRQVLQAVLIDVSKGVLNMVAIDGAMMAWRKTPIANVPDIQMLPKGIVLDSMSKLLGEGKATITGSANMIMIETKELKITLQVLGGKYMNYTRLISDDSSTTVKLNVKDLRQAIERSLLFNMSDNGKVSTPLSLKTGGIGLNLSLNSTTGEFNEEFSCEVKGADIEIGLDPRKLNDIFKHIEDKEVLVKLNGDTSPCLIVPVDGDKFIYMLAAIRLK